MLTCWAAPNFPEAHARCSTGWSRDLKLQCNAIEIVEDPECGSHPTSTVASRGISGVENPLSRAKELWRTGLEFNIKFFVGGSVLAPSYMAGVHHGGVLDRCSPWDINKGNRTRTEAVIQS